jgi:hypothetical protein
MERETDAAPGLFGRLLSLAGRAVHPFERAARRVLGPDGDLKVLAAAGAIVLYLLVRPVAAGIERTVSVPVRVLAASQTTTVVGIEPSSVSVTLRGTAEDFTAFDQDALHIELRPTPEENALSDVLSVGPKDLTNGINRLRVVAVSPSLVGVEYDFMSKIMTTNFVAKPRLLGRPIQGVASVSLPTNLAVTVYGSVKKLGAFSAKGIRLPTDPIDVEGKTESFDAYVAIRPPEDSGITSVEPAEVPVHVEIRTRAAVDADDIHVSAPILLKSEEEPAKAEPAEPAAPATNAVPSAEPAPAPVLEDVGSVPPEGDPFPDEAP